MPKLPDVDALATFLARHPLTKGLTSTDVAELLFALQVVVLAPGETLFAEGEPGDALYLVYEGVLHVERDGRTLGRVVPPQLVGELAVLDGQPRAATVRADTATICLRLAAAHLESLLASGSLTMHRLLVAVLRDLVRHVRPHLPDVVLGSRSARPA